MITPYYRSNDKDFTLLQGDCIELLKSFDFKFDMVFADPPYHDVQRGTIRTVSKLLSPGGKMLISLPEKYDYTQLIEDGFVFENERIYGNAKIVSLVREKA